MSVLFISPADKARTEAVRKELSRYFGGVKVQGTPDTEKINAHASDSWVFLFTACITCRKIEWGDYDTIFVSKRHVDALKPYYGVSKLQLFVVKARDDGSLHSFDIGLGDMSQFPLRNLGRGEPRDGATDGDREPTYLVPSREFQLVQCQ